MKQLSRRTWVGAAALAGVGLCAGCRSAAERNRSQVLTVFNWSDYLHPEVIPEFESRFRCQVVYDNYASDSELETRLATGGGAYDVVFPSDRAMQSLMAKGLLQPLHPERLPNFPYLDAKFLDAPFDPRNRFSAPYFWGTVALGVRIDKVRRPVSGFEVLFDRAHAGRITMLDDMENVVAAVLLHLGFPLNSVERSHLTLAKRLLMEQKPLVQAYTSDSYKERLVTGAADVALGWSGDLLQAADAAGERGIEVQVVVPRSGTMIWLDSMAIPQAAENVELAHAFINHLLDPAVAVRNAEHVSYATPNTAAFQRLPADVRNDISIYPPADTLARCDWLRNRGRDIEKIEAIWREVRA